MKILITGNLGYIGPTLCDSLIRAGHEVRGLDRGLYLRFITGPVAFSDQFIGDIRDHRAVIGALDACDAVIHLAGMANDPLGDLDEKITREVNFTASCSLIDAAGDRPFIFYSSASVYGSNPHICDESAPVNPLTIYARMKYEVERYLAGRPKTLILRNGTVHGPSANMRGDLMINAMVASAVTSGQIVVTTRPETRRPIIDVRDLAALTVSFLNLGATGTINMATGNIPVGVAASLVAEETGASVVHESAGADRRDYAVDPSRMIQLVPESWAPVSIQKSIRDIVALYRDSGLTAEDVRTKKFHRLRQYLAHRLGQYLGGES